jgi:Protein of unknown function (DUF1552)
MSKWPISRRTILRGLGVSMALPLLDAMMPKGLLGAGGEAMGAAATAGRAVAPVRMAFVFLPNGMWMPNFTPTKVGADFDLPASLAPLKNVAGQFSILSGLALDAARAHGDGAGDHARSAAAFLTGIHPKKTGGADIHLGVSVDQLAAQKVGSQTRLPSLELGCDKGRVAGECDSGYSCAYTSNLSWRGDKTPMPKEIDPAGAFERLFKASDGATTPEAAARRAALRKSVLDFVADDAKSLQSKVGKDDQRKLDEFTTSIREIEKRIEAARAHPVPVPDDQRPGGIPADFTEHQRLMYDMMVLAFRMDLTRISTFMVAHEGSDRHYRDIGVTEGHHTCSHHGAAAEKIESVKKIDVYHMQQFAYFLEKLKSIPEGNGTLLDNSMIVLGCGIGDGDRHNHNELPILLAGRAGGTLKPGRHVRYPKDTPLCNLYLSMLDVMGVKVDRFGDSTGRLTEPVS